MKNFMFFGSLLMAGSLAHAQTTLEELVQNGSVSVEAKSLGSHIGECLQIRVINQTNQTLSFKVEPGYEFQSDTESQDILVVDSRHFTLQPGASRSANLVGYCCRMTRPSPADQSTFTWAGKKRPALVQMAEYLVKNNLKLSQVAQSAVWAVSDGEPISALWDETQQESSKQLMTFTSQLTQRKMPWYGAHFTPITPGPQVIQQPRVMLKIQADWNFQIPQDDLISFAVYDPSGVKVRDFYSDKSFVKGRYVYTFSFETNKLDKGKYTFRMSGKNNGTIKEEILEL